MARAHKVDSLNVKDLRAMFLQRSQQATKNLHLLETVSIESQIPLLCSDLRIAASIA
jgi:hypothetical protein